MHITHKKMEIGITHNIQIRHQMSNMWIKLASFLCWAPAIVSIIYMTSIIQISYVVVPAVLIIGFFYMLKSEIWLSAEVIGSEITYQTLFGSRIFYIHDITHVKIKPRLLHGHVMGYKAILYDDTKKLFRINDNDCGYDALMERLIDVPASMYGVSQTRRFLLYFVQWFVLTAILAMDIGSEFWIFRGDGYDVIQLLESYIAMYRVAYFAVLGTLLTIFFNFTLVIILKLQRRILKMAKMYYGFLLASAVLPIILFLFFIFLGAEYDFYRKAHADTAAIEDNVIVSSVYTVHSAWTDDFILSSIRDFTSQRTLYVVYLHGQRTYFPRTFQPSVILEMQREHFPNEHGWIITLKHTPYFRIVIDMTITPFT